MKTLMYLIALSGVITANAQETPPPPIPDDEIIKLVKSDGKLIDFNSVDLDNYPNTEDEDLNRRTTALLIAKCSVEEVTVSRELPADVYEIDSVSYSMSGANVTEFLQTQKIIYEEDTIIVNKVKTVEHNYLKKYPDTIISYENIYYSFVQDTTILFEVFKKKRIWIGNIEQTFVGVSVNKLSQKNSIDLVLVPNPASDRTKAIFNLWKNGNVKISISNQSGTYNNVVYTGALDQGENRKNILLTGLSAGIYTVAVEFEGEIFSTNLIIQ